MRILQYTIVYLREYYTNGKRGKIYNKLSNNKRTAKTIMSKCDNKTLEENTVAGKRIFYRSESFSNNKYFKTRT